jgi:outer membrane protein assembly factor BamD (BamD/ComL family)
LYGIAVLGKIGLLFALIIACIVGFHRSLQDRSLLRFLDRHPQEQVVPVVAYTVGQGLYVFRELQEAATYFVRVYEQYPQSKLADDAHFYHLQCLDDSIGRSRTEMVVEYEKFLERFPESEYRNLVGNRIDAYKSGAR